MPGKTIDEVRPEVLPPLPHTVLGALALADSITARMAHVPELWHEVRLCDLHAIRKHIAHIEINTAQIRKQHL